MNQQQTPLASLLSALATPEGEAPSILPPYAPTPAGAVVHRETITTDEANKDAKDRQKTDSAKRRNARRSNAKSEPAKVEPAKVEPAKVEPAATPARKIAFTGYRPAAGASLYAHTAVFLAFSGIDKGAIPSSFARAIIGETAVKYHTAKGNFEVTREGLVLTEAGKLHFAQRKPSAELVAGWEQVLLDGKAHDAVLKNPALIKPIK